MGLVAALAALSPICTAGAASDEAAAKESLAEVFVTATRLASPRSRLAAAVDRVVPEPELRSLQGMDFAELLKTVPGLFVQSRYNSAQDLRIDLRGFGARGNFGIRGIRIFVDGIPAGLPDGQVQVDSLDPAQISSIEVLRGPAAAQYGNGAGGVILIETRSASDAPAWELASSLGENGFSSYAAGIGFADEGGPLALQLTAARQVLDGHREHARSDHRRLATVLAFKISERDLLEMRLRMTSAPLSQDPGGLSGADLRARPTAAAANNLRYDAGEFLDQQTLAWRWRHGGSKDTSGLELSNYFTWREFENRLPFRDGGAVRIDRRLGGASLQYRWAGPLAADWVTGIESDQQRDRRRRFDNDFGERAALTLDQEEIVTSTGLFLGSDHLLGPFSVQGALRFDMISLELRDAFLADGDDSGTRRFHKLSHGLGLHRQWTDQSGTYIRYAAAFDTPTTTELANPSGSGFNAALEPQTSRSLEIGWRFAPADSGSPGLELTLYQVNAEDEFIAFELPAQPGRSFFENAGATRRRGAELALGLRTGSASWRLSAARADARFRSFENDGDSFAGNKLPGTPGLRVAATMDWEPREDWRLGVDLERVERVFADNENKVRSPDYLDASLRAAWGVSLGDKRFEAYAGVKNLLDRRFADNLRVNAFGGRYFEPAPGRYFYAGMRYSAAR